VTGRVLAGIAFAALLLALALFLIAYWV